MEPSATNKHDCDYIDVYHSEFRNHVHQLLIWGYKDARKRIKSQHDETDITGFIAEAIDAKLDAPDSPLWCNQCFLKEDPPVPSGDRTGRRRGRPDLIFGLVTKRPRLKYFFESKRLRKQSTHRESYYLGEEGLQRFLHGYYAKECSEAGMLGYVQCDTVDEWSSRLKTAINDDAANENKLLLKPPLRNVYILREITNEWVSEHNRENRENSISIHHILLDCCT